MGYIYLVTGATSDLGRNMIDRILKKSTDSYVIACGFNDKNKIADVLEKYTNRIEYIDVNLASIADIDSLISFLKNKNYQPTHYIHFPALPVVNVNFLKFDEERFFEDQNVQVLSAVKICKYVIQNMKKNKFGRILFMQSSYIIGCPPKNVAAYTMIKSSLGALIKSLAIEYAKFGITVNSVAPSMIETNFVKDLNHLVVEMSANDNPMGRNATVDDVVPAIEFLLSEEARFISGVNLPITGGSAMI